MNVIFRRRVYGGGSPEPPVTTSTIVYSRDSYSASYNPYVIIGGSKKTVGGTYTADIGSTISMNSDYANTKYYVDGVAQTTSGFNDFTMTVNSNLTISVTYSFTDSAVVFNITKG